MLVNLVPRNPKFIQPQKFWCNACDQNKVDADNQETGYFFKVHGHTYDATTKEFDGDYVGVMFAICKSCLPLHHLQDFP